MDKLYSDEQKHFQIILLEEHEVRGKHTINSLSKKGIMQVLKKNSINHEKH